MNYTNRKTEGIKKTPGCGPTGCPKAGIKIHETPTNNTNTNIYANANIYACLLYTSPSPRD